MRPMSAVDRLDQIEARAQAATEGPWEWHPYGVSGRTLATPGPVIGGFPTHELNVLKTTDDWPPNDPDAEFIAAARTDVPVLVAAVRAVLDKHQPLDAIHTVTGKPLQVCSGCGRDRDWMPWPCPTVQAVTDALGGERA